MEGWREGDGGRKLWREQKGREGERERGGLEQKNGEGGQGADGEAVIITYESGR